MNVIIQVDCLAVHVDEVCLILEGQKFKPLRLGKGFGRVLSSFEGQTTLPTDILKGSLVSALSDRCKDPIKVTVTRE
jgi:hypothetical protein